MTTNRVVATGLNGGVGGRWVSAWGHWVGVEWDGHVTAIDPATGNVKHLGGGYLQPEDVVATADASMLYLTERGGDVWQVDPNNADRMAAKQLVSGLNAPHQMALTADGKQLYVVEFAPGSGRLVRIDTSTGDVEVIVTGVNLAVGLLLNADESLAYVSEQGSGGRLLVVDVLARTITPILSGLQAPFYLAWADVAEALLLVPERDPANRLTLVDLKPALPKVVNLGTMPFRPSSAVVAGTEILVCCDAQMVAVDIAGGLMPTVSLQMPNKPLYVGGYARIPVKIGGIGLGFDALSFQVVQGPEGGSLTMSRDARFDLAFPEVMLLGGSVPGSYSLTATETATGNVMVEEKFELSAEWDDQDNGPSIAFTGPTNDWVTGGAWGGGPVGPQNVNVLPAAGVRRIALLLVDSNDSRWPTTGTTIADARTLWANELMGTTPDPDGVRRSTHHFFQECSDGRFDVSLVGNQVYGPFSLPSGWTGYYDWVKDRSSWWYNGNLMQAVVTAAQDAVNFDDVDTVVVIMRSLTSSVQMGTTMYSWPVAAGGNLTYHLPGQTGTKQRAIPALNMPADWQLVDSGGRRIHETLAHEIGHNLGLPDLYMNVTGFDPSIAARDVGPWDLMSQENPLPHMSMAHKLMLGWVNPANVRSFDFAAGGGVDQTLTLQATSALGASGPPAGRLAGIEIRRADGWNYYFEYRSGQGVDIGDRQLNPNRAILGTDVVSGLLSVPLARRAIILLGNDRDGDGSVLSGAGTDYEEDDPSGPAKFQFDVVSTAADSAQVRIRYGGGGRPDPSIRPWPGGDNWRSPDIEVRNAKSDLDGAWLNVPWAGHTNRVVAKVGNGGNFLAKSVVVNFFVKDFSITNAPEFSIGSETKDVAPGATVEFQANWTPPANTPTEDAHYCLVVRIPLFQDPGNPAIVELTELNNVAQSNYTRFISDSASPSSRGISHVVVNNPYPERTRVFVVGQQSMDFYRTYLQHQWVWLSPGETRRIEVMYESLAGDPLFAAKIKEIHGRFYEMPNRVSLIGLMENPMDEHLHAPDVAGGANIIVASGRKTKIIDLHLDRDVARGKVITVDDGKGVNHGQMLITIAPDGQARRELTRSGQVFSDGRFTIELNLGHDKEAQKLLTAKTLWMRAHYLGGFMWADCQSEIVHAKP